MWLLGLRSSARPPTAWDSRQPPSLTSQLPSVTSLAAGSDSDDVIRSDEVWNLCCFSSAVITHKT